MFIFKFGGFSLQNKKLFLISFFQLLIFSNSFNNFFDKIIPFVLKKNLHLSIILLTQKKKNRALDNTKQIKKAEIIKSHTKNINFPPLFLVKIKTKTYYKTQILYHIYLCKSIIM